MKHEDLCDFYVLGEGKHCYSSIELMRVFEGFFFVFFFNVSYIFKTYPGIFFSVIEVTVIFLVFRYLENSN